MKEESKSESGGFSSLPFPDHDSSFSGLQNRTTFLGTSLTSPYLNYDSRTLQQAKPEFIFLDGANEQRGRFELSFTQIGLAVMIGTGIGGCAGFYNGLRTTNALKQTGKVWRTQMLNHVMKQGSATANIFGTISVMYSIFGVFCQFVRGKDDNINTLLAGTGTGILYKSTAGLRKCAIGGGFGLGVSALYCLCQLSKDDVLDKMNLKLF